MMRSIPEKLFVLMLLFPTLSFAVTLDEIFLHFRKCEFTDFYYAPWDTSQPIRPYFSERKLTPYDDNDGLYYFDVKDSLFGFPVSRLIVPGTSHFVGVVFDAPLNKVHAGLKQRFHTNIVDFAHIVAGKPVLDKYDDGVTSKSILYCDLRDSD